MDWRLARNLRKSRISGLDTTNFGGRDHADWMVGGSRILEVARVRARYWAVDEGLGPIGCSGMLGELSLEVPFGGLVALRHFLHGDRLHLARIFGVRDER